MTHHHHDHHDHHLTPRVALAAARHFWTSDVNRAAVDLLDPGEGEHLLDLAAGLGPATIEAARRVGPSGRVVAIDPSRSMRAAIRTRRLWQRARTSIEVRAGSAERLPLTRESIDAALSLNAMHHFPDLEGAAGELARVLKHGGRLLLIDEDFGDDGHSFHGMGGEHDHGPEFVEPDHVASLLTDAGLADATGDHRAIGGEPAFVITATKP
jgi:SAM-dependent methyltransferase